MQFTSICLALWAYAWASQSTYWLSLVIPLMWGSAVAFTCAPLFDANVFAALRRRRGWTMTEFYLGHALLHVVPLVMTMGAVPVRTWDGIRAAVFHLTWGLLESPASALLSLDEVYVPMRLSAWRNLFAIAALTEVFLVPALW